MTTNTEATTPLRSAERDDLLARVEIIRQVILDNAETAERERTLPEATLEAFRAQNLFKVGAPREVGGLEVDPITQTEVVEAVARLDGSAAWLLMIGSQGAGNLGAVASEQALEEIFGSGWPSTAGQIHGTSTVKRIEGGYVFDGKWSFASGIRHATWVTFSSHCKREDDPDKTFLAPLIERATAKLY
jgi:alkylation response protein AidB-like acyl-CoA dehydrogenase